MGNRNSTADTWDSSDEGGSDYEHKYDFHTSVLHKSPYDGFESDYEDDDYFPPSVSQSCKQVAQADTRQVGNGGVVSMNRPTAEPSGVGCSGEKPGASPAGNSKSEPVTVAGGSLQTPPVNNDVNIVAAQNLPTQKADRQKVVQPRNSASPAQGSASISREIPTVKGQQPVEVDDVYETAGEEHEGDENTAEASDDDSLSTITPPRTRPQSDSEYSVDMDTDSEDSEDSEESESDVGDFNSATEQSVTVTTKSRSQSSDVRRKKESDVSNQSLRRSARLSPPAPHRRLRHREGLSPDSYRQTRKRRWSPAPLEKRSAKVPRKQMKQITLAPGTPTKVRYGYISTDSESDAEKKSQRRKNLRSSAHSEPAQNQREKKSSSARAIRQAARQAATQFLETSRKILQDARTAARILRGSASKRRSSVADGTEMASLATQPSPPRRERRESERARRDSESSDSDRTPTITTRSRRAAVKRKASPEESPRSAETKQTRQNRGMLNRHAREEPLNMQTETDVRKNGGLLRKFTRSAESSGTQTLDVAASRSSMQASSLSPGGIHTSIQKSASVAGPRNPFTDIQLIPAASYARTVSSPTESVDSINVELDPSLQSKTVLQYKNPFVSLLSQADRSESPEPVAFTSGSVWARVNMRTNQLQQVPSQGSEQVTERQSPQPGPSGQKRASCSSPQTVGTGHSPSSSSVQDQGSSASRISALTLTGQFAHSGRFAFLLEDVLQVTISTGDITKTTTNAIVISTDAQLRHQNPLAQSVATAAGPGFARKCNELLRNQTNGLQVCEVWDTPAGGRLPQLTSHVLHVVVPCTGSSEGSGNLTKWRKLLLCTYVNCLKHASEKLHLQTIAFPLLGAGTYPADECIHIFFDSLLIYLAERTSSCPLHGIQLIISKPAIACFASQVLETRLETILVEGIDSAMAAAFRDYFGIPDFSRPAQPVESQVAADRNMFGKPAVKRRRL